MGKFEIMTKCGECGGVGQVSPPVPLGTLDANWPASITCPTCEGSGKASSSWIRLNKLEDKINDVMDKCNDIFEKVSE